MPQDLSGNDGTIDHGQPPSMPLHQTLSTRNVIIRGRHEHSPLFETDFVWVRRSSRLIDRHTFLRTEPFVMDGLQADQHQSIYTSESLLQVVNSTIATSNIHIFAPPIKQGMNLHLLGGIHLSLKYLVMYWYSRRHVCVSSCTMHFGGTSA
jgi:hypothetical protein